MKIFYPTTAFEPTASLSICKKMKKPFLTHACDFRGTTAHVIRLKEVL